MRLFYRLLGYLFVGTVTLIAIAEYLNYHSEIEQFEADMVANAIQDGKSISGMVAHVWKESGEKRVVELLEDASRSGMMPIRWVWLDNLLREATLMPGSTDDLQRLSMGENLSLKRKERDGVEYLYTYVTVDIGQERHGALELRQSLVNLQRFSRKMVGRALMISFLLALVCGTILYWFINRNIRMPLNQLMNHANRIGQGDFRAEPNISGKDELAEMARTMNDMCSRLVIAQEKIRLESEARLKTLEQLRHTERLSTFGLISAGIAHEIGTPLNVVDGRAKMIMNDGLDSGEIRESAAIIQNQAERMTAIVRQLLDFTRRPKQQISSENISFLIRQVFQFLYPMSSKQGISLSLSTEEGAEVMLYADGTQIQQVIMNVLINSIQAMPEGGRIDVTIANELQTDDRHPERAAAKFMAIRIVDEGEGIRKEHLEHIFTPFFTTKNVGTGTGLGLSIAHGIVEEHGGWIDVESTEGNGTCFAVFLPMKEHDA